MSFPRNPFRTRGGFAFAKPPTRTHRPAQRMNDPEFDGAPEGEGEDRWELAWNEFDWESYLREQDQAVRRYVAFYDACAKSPEKLDETARLMGWEIEGEEEVDFSQAADEQDEDEDDDDEEDDDDGDFSPYTIHKHPVFIATCGIRDTLTHAWGQLVRHYLDAVPPVTVAEFPAAFHRGVSNAQLGIHALDLGDHALAIAHFKRGLADLNTALAALGHVPDKPQCATARFASSARIWVFDLREVWLRVMRDCREDQARGFVNED